MAELTLTTRLETLASDANRLASILNRLLETVFEDTRAQKHGNGNADYAVPDEQVADLQWLMWALAERVRLIDAAVLAEHNAEVARERAAEAKGGRARQ